MGHGRGRGRAEHKESICLFSYPLHPLHPCFKLHFLTGIKGMDGDKDFPGFGYLQPQPFKVNSGTTDGADYADGRRPTPVVQTQKRATDFTDYTDCAPTHSCMGPPTAASGEAGSHPGVPLPRPPRGAAAAPRDGAHAGPAPRPIPALPVHPRLRSFSDPSTQAVLRSPQLLGFPPRSFLSFQPPLAYFPLGSLCSLP